MKKPKIRAAHVITLICIIAALGLLCSLFNSLFVDTSRTVLRFTADGVRNGGFSREAVVYTEDGATYVNFSGDITTDGTAKISLIAESGEVVYSDTYTSVESQKLDIKITDLTPQTYYILRFSSNNAKTGHLFLTTEQTLVERPAVPEHPERTIPEHNAK